MSDQATQDARPEDMSPEQLRMAVTMLRAQVEAERAATKRNSDMAGRLERKWERAGWERDIMRAALEAIRDDIHCSYDWSGIPAKSEADRQYQIGTSDGHRCAANKAREALVTVEADLSESDGVKDI